MKQVFDRILGSLFGGDKAWWIEVKTDQPPCTYYFGPFDIAQEAELAKQGYIEDLEQEGAKNVQATVMNCKAPQQLTVDNNGAGATFPKVKPAFSGQV